MSDYEDLIDKDREIERLNNLRLDQAARIDALETVLNSVLLSVDPYRLEPEGLAAIPTSVYYQIRAIMD